MKPMIDTEIFLLIFKKFVCLQYRNGGGKSNLHEVLKRAHCGLTPPHFYAVVFLLKNLSIVIQFPMKLVASISSLLETVHIFSMCIGKILF